MKRLSFFLLVTTLATVAFAAEPAVLSAPVDLAGGAVHGTLLMPARSAGAMPVVLLISGSGPTDRDGNSAVLPGRNDSLRMIAAGLAADGIASVRYDKRGIAQSAKGAPAEADLRFDTYVDDAAGWCAQLRDDRRFSTVVIVGHSEGSLIGMVAAKRCGASGFVSIAGAGRPAADILRSQLKGKLPPELAAQSEEILSGLEQGKTSANPPAALAKLYRPSVQPYLISWFRYDPAKAIAALTVPVAILQGTTDIQVGVADAERLAAAQPKAKLVVVEGMNHVLKSVPADLKQQMASYSDPSLPLAKEVVPTIVALVKSVR